MQAGGHDLDVVGVSQHKPGALAEDKMREIAFGCQRGLRDPQPMDIHGVEQRIHILGR